MLLKTTNAQKHYHLAFIRDDGSGYTSIDSGHFHSISTSEEFETFEVDQKQLVDEFYNSDPADFDKDKNIAESQTLEKFKLSNIQTVNNHSHQLTGITLKSEKKEDELTEQEKVRRVYELTKECMDADADSKQKAEESERFACGNQWSSVISGDLANHNKAELTLNYTKRLLKFLSGLYRQQKKDIQVLPEEESDNFAADILNPVLRRVQHNTHYHTEEIQAWDDMTKVGRCGMMVDIDTEANPLGDVSVTYFHWKDFSVERHIKIDGSDAHIMAIHPKYSYNEVKAMYPEKADDLTKMYSYIDTLYRHGSAHVQHEGYEAYRDSMNSIPFLRSDNSTYRWVDVTRKQIMVIHLYEKEKTNKKIAANAIEDEYIEVTRLYKKDLEKVKKLEGFALINSTRTKVKLSIVSGSTLLEEKYTLFDDFNLCWAYADKTLDGWSGIVEDVKDPQREINKWSSKFSDMLNQADAWHLGVSPSAFANEADYQEYIENSTTPGYVPKFADGFEQYVKEYSNSNYAQLRDTLSGVDLAIRQMSDITNIQPSILGASNVAESGVALAQKTRAGLVGNEYLFDNFSAMKMKIGKLIIQAIQKTWSPERILRLTESQNNREAITVGGDALYPTLKPQELLNFGVNRSIISQEDAQGIFKKMQEGEPDPNTQAIMQKLQDEYKKFRREQFLLVLENSDLTKFDVAVVENTHSPTTMLSNFMILAELAKTRPDIPISAIIKSYPFLSSTDKNELIQGMQAQAQAQQEEQQLKSQTELQKTMIAAQSKNGGSGQTGQPPQPQ